MKELKKIRMKRIGILTFHKADNYGAVLQNYALQQAIITMGMKPETIDYYSQAVEKVYKIWGSVRFKFSILCLVKKIASNIMNFRNAVISKKKFEYFRKKYLNISSVRYDADTISTAEYDVYIAGSDQIWNKLILGKEDIPVYTLAFAEEHTATYGASSGSEDNFINDVESISKIQLITVREQQLHNALKKVGIISRVVCDPVFLLEKDNWIKLIKNTPRKKYKYVFLYYLDNGKEQAAMIAKSIADSMGIKIYYPRKYDMLSIMNHYGINRFSDGPLDFLDEIYRAEYVVSSSFHGVAFALLMEKDFVAVLHKETGERVKNLLEHLGLEERIVTDLEEFQKRNRHWESIDYRIVREKVNKFREESMECLREICRL